MRFTDRDEYLRKVGMYCEEVFDQKDLPRVLKGLVKMLNSTPNLWPLAIVPADTVILRSDMPGKFALYMPIKRLENLPLLFNQLPFSGPKGREFNSGSNSSYGGCSAGAIG